MIFKVSTVKSLYLYELKIVQPARANNILTRLKVILFDSVLNTLPSFILYDTEVYDNLSILIYRFELEAGSNCHHISVF